LFFLYPHVQAIPDVGSVHVGGTDAECFQFITPLLCFVHKILVDVCFISIMNAMNHRARTWLESETYGMHSQTLAVQRVLARYQPPLCPAPECTLPTPMCCTYLNHTNTVAVEMMIVPHLCGPPCPTTTHWRCAQVCSGVQRCVGCAGLCRGV
jgi:hypothetical protein